MKYIGIKNCSVVDYWNNKLIFKFDKNGLFETTDDKIIKFMKKQKPNIKCEELKQYNCKKCDFTSDNMGLLLAHYRKIHSKED